MAPTVFAAPIRLQGNRVWLDVSVEGLPPEPFILDTGTTESLISDSWASSVKLRERGASIIGGLGGVERTSVLRVEDVVIGGTFRIPYMEFHGTKSVVDSRTRGLIGAPLFTDMDSDLDFVANQWRIYPDGRSERPGMYLIPQSYMPRRASYGLTTPVQIGDFSGRFLIDTGAPRNILLDGKAARDIGWWDSERPYVPVRASGFGKGSLRTRMFRADKVLLHKFAFPRALVTLAEPGPRNGNFDNVEGLVGLDMIRHFHLSTDPKRKQLWMAPNGLNFAGTERYPMSGLWLDRKGTRIVIEDVGNGSPAKDAGLQPGDALVGVEWNAMLRRLGGKPGDEIAFDYERDGTRGHAQFNLKPYL
ncbi:aspartyl protease family protein [uncultured Sphingopyxis sp.]|uniref:aspartyl protease family protein n=1 Tax=uncultured Sphingopyxis sp. TaxID=310581 RepID=UPI0025916A14|nr:aspartyl protease family protein [uncultured Sphingopyxis sp.]